MVVEFGQPGQVGVENGHVGAEAHGDGGGVRAGDAAADDDDPPGACPARLARAGPGRHGPSAWRCAPTIGASRPATSLIGASSGSPPGGQLHGLVGDRRDLVRDERVGQRPVGGEVQVGEQHEVVAEVAVLAPRSAP